MQRRTIIIALLILLIIAISASAAEEEKKIYIIVHPENPISNKEDLKIKKEDLKNIFTGKTTIWKDWEKKTPIAIVMMKESEDFLKMIDMTPIRFKKIWVKFALSGRKGPPNTFKTKSEVLEFVKKTPGAIGWLVGEDTLKLKEVLNKEVKVLSIETKESAESADK